MTEIAMPRLSDSMEEGTILRWLKRDGEQVARGEELVEIETDKATMTYESDRAGTLTLLAAEGDTLPVGAPIARVGASAANKGSTPPGPATGEPTPASAPTPAPPPGPATEVRPPADAPTPAVPPHPETGERPPADAPTPAPPPGPATEVRPPADAPTPAPPPHPATGEPTPAGTPTPAPARELGDRVKASPLARRIAREGGIDLHDVEPSGPGGRVVKADVLAAAGGGGAKGVTSPSSDGARESGTAPAGEKADVLTAKGETTLVELTRIQQTVARRMAESKATIPDFTLLADVDMEACVALRAELKSLSHGDDEAHPPTYNDMVVKTCALALREHPQANGSYRDGRVQLHSRINVGVAVAARDALVVPTVFDADEKSLGEIARETRRLAERVRDATIAPPELGGGTFTVSNLGMFGVRSFTAIVNPPQAAIMSVGALEQRAVAYEGELAVRHALTLTLVCDHRILYGAEAARFLARVRELLQSPAALTL